MRARAERRWHSYDLLDKLDGIMILCCWAHCRRYFDRALNHDRKRAEHGIEQIGLIYSVETIADEEGASYERRAQLRQELAYPIIRGLEAWALNEQEAVMPKSSCHAIPLTADIRLTTTL